MFRLQPHTASPQHRGRPLPGAGVCVWRGEPGALSSSQVRGAHLRLLPRGFPSPGKREETPNELGNFSGSCKISSIISAGTFWCTSQDGSWQSSGSWTGKKPSPVNRQVKSTSWVAASSQRSFLSTGREGARAGQGRHSFCGHKASLQEETPVASSPAPGLRRKGQRDPP